MELFESAEKKSQRHEERVKKLIDENKRLDALEEDFFESLGIPFKAFVELMSDMENFSPEWREWIASEEKKMSDKLKTELASVSDRHKAFETLKQLHQAQSWINCR